MLHDREVRVDTVIEGGQVVTPGGVATTDVAIADGKIVAFGARLRGGGRVPARGLWVLPGAIDGHTHMQAPAFGRTTRDTFASGSRAAAAGGVTTFLDFTVGSGATALADDVEKRTSEAGASLVDFGLHAEVVAWSDGRAEEIPRAVAGGVPSFKFYTVYAERLTYDELARAFAAVAAAGGVAMVHAEDLEVVERASSAIAPADRRRMAAFPRSRPPESEASAVAHLCEIAAASGARLHIAHVSTAAAAAAIARAKARGVRVTAETCPHYLLLDESAYAREDGRLWSVVPPLRSPDDRAALWSALEDGTIDTVATDHCPFARADKEGAEDVLAMPCGLSGVETLLPLVASEGVAGRRLPLARLARALAENPARIFGLAPAKGTIAVGADADLVLFDPARAWTVSAADLHSATDLSPWEGFAVRGRVVRTFARGRCVFADGEFPTDVGTGRFVPRRLV